MFVQVVQFACWNITFRKQLKNTFFRHFFTFFCAKKMMWRHRIRFCSLILFNFCLSTFQNRLKFLSFSLFPSYSARLSSTWFSCCTIFFMSMIHIATFSNFQVCKFITWNSKQNRNCWTNWNCLKLTEKIYDNLYNSSIMTCTLKETRIF